MPYMLRSTSIEYALVARGVVNASVRTLGRALKNANWSCQRVRKRLPITNHAERVKLCQRHGRTIATGCAFSDSKYFEGEPNSKSSLNYAWAPDGEPVQQPGKAKAAYKVHAYAGITKYGATKLFECSGTVGPSGRGRGEFSYTALG